MAEFKVTPNMLKEHSTKFTNFNNEFKTLVDAVNRDMTSMKTNWEGLASESFYKKFQDMRSGFFPVLNQTIDEYARFLNTSAASYESAETTVKSESDTLRTRA